MKRRFLSLSLVILSGAASVFTSCSDDETKSYLVPEVQIEKPEAGFTLVQGDSIVLKPIFKNLEEATFQWEENGKIVSTDTCYTFIGKETGQSDILFTVTTPGGKASASATVDVYGKYKYGTFILNEGNMTTENGFLTFISTKGIITDSVYFKENGTSLGNSAQSLFIADKKIYIISQNGNRDGSNDGRLVIANAETLKKEAAYENELATLSMPTHIVTTGVNNLYIRDNNGIHLFNPSSKKLLLIKGTKGASKNAMAVVGDKIFAQAGSSVLVLQANNDSIIKKIDFDASVSGVIKSSDGNIWVSCTSNPAKIMKVNPASYAVIKTNEITDAKIGSGWAATPGISAKGDTLYFSNASTKIYRHIFNTGQTDFMVDAKTMVDDANMVYNNLSVDPVSGQVYLNTIKGYGWDFLINNISVFDFSGTTPKLSANYKNHTHFPAGIFFTASFQ